MSETAEKTDRLTAITVTLEEGDRQMVLLALAEVALSRPGFDMGNCFEWPLAELIDRFNISTLNWGNIYAAKC